MKKTIPIIMLLNSFLFADQCDNKINDYNSKNYTKAFKCFMIDAEKDDIIGQFRVAYMYKKGLGTLVDYKKSLYWHTRAANNGHAVSQFILAQEYYTGKFVFKDLSEAIYWYNRSANQQYPDAQYKLAVFYIKGEVLLRDYKKAKYWMSKAHENGHFLATYAWNKYELWKY